MTNSFYRFFYPILILSLLGLFGCSSAVRYTSSGKNDVYKSYRHRNEVKNKESDNEVQESKSNLNPNEQNIVDEASRYLGISYCFGGTSCDCFDCSGFVQVVYSSFGISLPRTAEDQYQISEKIKSSLVKAGDLAFFGKNGRISHVGIYIGNNEIIHASTSKGVIRQSLDDAYLKDKLTGFGRILNN